MDTRMIFERMISENWPVWIVGLVVIVYGIIRLPADKARHNEIMSRIGGAAVGDDVSLGGQPLSMWIEELNKKSFYTLVPRKLYIVKWEGCKVGFFDGDVAYVVPPDRLGPSCAQRPIQCLISVDREASAALSSRPRLFKMFIKMSGVDVFFIRRLQSFAAELC